LKVNKLKARHCQDKAETDKTLLCRGEEQGIMNSVLHDNRKYKAMKADEADALLKEIVELRIEEVRLAAIYEKKCAAIKSEYEEKAAPITGIIKDKAAELEAYINANPERFQKPRARKTLFGSYGLRSVSGLEITDELTVIQVARRRGLPLYTEVTKIDKKAIENAINAGEDIPGAQIVSGERAFFKEDKALLDKARQTNNN